MPKVEFIVEADVPALFFSSKVAAEQYMEAIDVIDGVYPRAFRANGLLYRIEPCENHATLVSVREFDAQGLRDVLVSFLSSESVPYSEENSLHELLEKCIPYIIE